MRKQILFLILVVLLVGAVSAEYEKAYDEQGNLIIKEGDNTYAVPEGLDILIDEDNNLVFTNLLEEDNLFEFNDFLIQLEKGSKIEYSEIDGQTFLDLEGEGDIEIGETALHNIKDASISLNENDQIDFAEFISTTKEEYIFNYENKEFVFNTEAGSKVFFNPSENIIQGENAKLDIGYRYIEGDEFNLFLDERGEINRIEISKDGFYNDLINDLKYSSNEDFLVYLDGRDISQEKNAISVLDVGHIQAKGKVNVEDGILYQGLIESSFFERKLQGDNELISINADEDRAFEQGGIARFTKKVKVGNLLQDEGFIEGEEGISTIISRKNGKINVNIHEDSLNLLTEIEKDTTKFALLDKNLMVELGDEEAYFGVNENFGMIYQTTRGTVEILGAGSTHKYLGDDLNTVQAIVADQVTNNLGDTSLDVQSLGIQKIYDLQRKSYRGIDEQGNEKQFMGTLDSFEETKEFIKQVYADPLLESATLSSFMVGNLEEIDIDWESSEWESQRQIYKRFKEENLFELKNNLESNEFVRSYLHGEQKGDLNLLSETLLQKAYSSPGFSSQYKDSFEKILQNRILYEDMANHYISEHERDGSLILDSYRGLLLLEDSKISTLGEGLEINMDSSIFSTRKLNLGEALAFEYAQQDKLSDAIAVIDQLEDNFNDYVNDVSFQMDLNDPANEEVYGALKGLHDKIILDRATLSNPGFNKIQLDLYTQSGEIQKVFGVRKGYTQKVSEAESGLGKIGVVVFSGGFGKDIVDLAGGFDDVKEVASVLEEENQIYSKGTYGIQSLNQMGVSGQIIDDWANNRLVESEKKQLVNELLVKSGRASKVIKESPEFKGIEVGEDGKPTGKKIITTSLSDKYAVDPEKQRLVFEFLEETRKDAKITYDSDLYGWDIKKLIGTSELQYTIGEYKTQEKLSLETDLQKAIFEGRIQSLEMSDAGKVLNFIDDGLSPGAIAIGAVTGGIGGTFFSGATGLAGAGIGIAENVFIDAVAGTILVSSGVNPEEKPWLAIGTAVGTGVATGIPRMLNGLAKSQILSADNYAKAIVDATGDSRVSNALRGLTSKQIRDSNFVVGKLKSYGISVDESLITKSISNLELETAVAKMNANDLALIGITKTRQGELVDESGKAISNLNELQRYTNNIQVKSNAVLKFEEARNAMETFQAKYPETYADNLFKRVKNGETNLEDIANIGGLRKEVSELSRVKSLDEINDFNRIGDHEEVKKLMQKQLKEREFKIKSRTFFEGETIEREIEELHYRAGLFDSWYSGNYNPETGKMTLYRYVDEYEGFDKVMKGESDVLPIGYATYGTEENLVNALKQDGRGEYANAILKSRKGEDLSGFFNKHYQYSEIGAEGIGNGRGFDKDPFAYWTTNKPDDIWTGDRKYMIEVELDPSEAYRRGGGLDDSDLIGGTYEAEWTTIGPVSKNNIVEIRNLETGEIVVPSRVKKSADNLLLIKDQMINRPEGYSYYAHGTNGKTLESILETDEMILPGRVLKERGIISLTGESGATTPLNRESISTIALDHFGTSGGTRRGHIDNAIIYAQSASEKFSVTPLNIDEKIIKMEELVSGLKTSDYTEGSIVDIIIKSQEDRLLELRNLKKTFSELNFEELAKYEELSKIPVVVVGKNQKGFEGFVHSDIRGEVSLPSLKAETVAVPKEYMSTIQFLLNTKGSSIRVISLEELENLQRFYLTH